MNRTLLCVAIAVAAAAGCDSALDQDRPPPRPVPTTGPAVATGDRGVPQPLPGLTPSPKPFVDTDRFTGGGDATDQPSVLLQTHAVPDAPVPLSLYGRQPVHATADFGLSPTLTASGVRQRFGPPAGVAGIGDSWAVYRLTFGRELWLHFANGDGALMAADVVRGRETGYSRERVYPAE